MDKPRLRDHYANMPGLIVCEMPSFPEFDGLFAALDNVVRDTGDLADAMLDMSTSGQTDDFMIDTCGSGKHTIETLYDSAAAYYRSLGLSPSSEDRAAGMATYEKGPSQRRHLTISPYGEDRFLVTEMELHHAYHLGARDN